MDHQSAGYLLRSTRDPQKYVGIGDIKLVLNSSLFWNYENENGGGKFHLKANDTNLPLGNKTWTAERNHNERYILLKSITCGQNIAGYKLGGRKKENESNANDSEEECVRQAMFSTQCSS